MRSENQKTILLVEDEVITAMAEKMTLEKYGYKVITANTGEEAVDTVEKTPSIDLILMDIDLGTGIDGAEAAAIILRERDLPVVFLSSHTEPEVVAKTEKITSYGYVVKNSSITVLDASIKMAFKLFESIINEKEKESQMEAGLEALRKSEQRLNFHINNSPLATIEWTTDFIVTRWSGEAEKTFGWNQSETIGKPMMDLQMIYDEDIPTVQKTMERLSDGSSKHVVSTNRNYTKEGKVIICEWYNSVLLNPQGKMISVMSQAMDITERKRAEEQLRLLSSVTENITDAITVTDANFAITYINKVGENFFGYTLDELKGQTLGIFNAEPMAEQIQQELYKIVSSGKTYLGESLNRRKDGSTFYCEYKVMPLKDSKGIIYGYTSIQRDITERKQAEEANFQSKKDWEDCFDTITDMITIHDNDYNIVRANKAGKALLKLPALEKHLQTKCFSFYHGTDAPPAGCPSCDCLKNGMPGVFELFEPYLNRYLEIRAIPRFDSHNQRAGMIHIVRDITERKRVEELLAIQARIAAVFLTMPDDEMFNEVLKIVLEVMRSPFGIFGYLDENGDWVVPTMTRQDWDKRQIPDKTVQFPRGTSEDGIWACAVREKRTILSNEPSTNIPAGLVGIQRHISMPILFKGEVIGLFQVANKATDYTEADIHTLTEITEYIAPLLSARVMRERAQEALRVNEKKLKEAQVLGQIGNWEYDIKNQKITWSDQVYKLYERDPVLGPPTAEEEAVYYSPEQGQTLRGYKQNAIETGQFFEYDLQATLPSGKHVYLTARLRPIKDAQGRVIKLFGIVQDITERKQAEEKIKNSLAKKEILL